MKAISFYLIVLLTFVMFTNVLAEDGYHTVKYPLSEQLPAHNYYTTFRDTPDDMPLIRSFPTEALQSYPEILDVRDNIKIFPLNYGMRVTIQLKDSVETLPVFYWIHTSASEAEEGYVDRISGANIIPQNSSDYKDIEKIGDNCFHYMKRMIYFIRNNVRVHVNLNPSYLNYEAVLRIAELIDEALVQADKINDISKLQAPVITSVTLLDDTLPRFHRIKVDAYDPSGKSLFYDYTGRPLSVDSFEDGILEILKLKINRTINIWVINEDRLVSKHSIFTPSAKVPPPFILNQNAPNPFNPGTAIGYELTQPGQVSLRIYDLLGREVSVSVDGIKDAGYHEAYWNGKDSTGNPAASGVYLYRLEAGGSAETRRMMLVR